MTLDEILHTLEQHADTLREYGVERIGVFGSYSRHDANPDSDIDFLVQLQRHTFDAYMNTKLFLEDTFGKEVDLVIEEDIREELRSNILGEVVYAATT